MALGPGGLESTGKAFPLTVKVVQQDGQGGNGGSFTTGRARSRVCSSSQPQGRHFSRGCLQVDAKLAVNRSSQHHLPPRDDSGIRRLVSSTVSHCPFFRFPTASPNSLPCSYHHMHTHPIWYSSIICTSTTLSGTKIKFQAPSAADRLSSAATQLVATASAPIRPSAVLNHEQADDTRVVTGLLSSDLNSVGLPPFLESESGGILLHQNHIQTVSTPLGPANLLQILIPPLSPFPTSSLPLL
jgi:hypothetical protein